MTSGWALSLQPFLPAWALMLAAALSAIVALLLLWARRPGAVWRALGLATLLVFLLNPHIVHELRKPDADIAIVVADESESQDFGLRKARRDAALNALRGRIKSDPTLELRELRLGRSDDGTMIFGPLSRALSDVPPDRVAGLILLTDGIIHDAPKTVAELPVRAPMHVLLTGSEKEADRKLTIVKAPVFAIVGEPVSIVLRVDDRGELNAEPREAEITVSIDGHGEESQRIEVGREVTLPLTLHHGGENVVEVVTEPGPSEITLLNNRVAFSANGVRDRLRVLLVTGEPHAGERTWRNLLKADPGVDLVHFTILRPPEKQDGTPIDELSLIAFPTRELFVDKLDQFDLVIFDRYRRHGVLPIVYLDNVARYVEQGGALLDAAGPSFAGGLSLYRTPLAAVLPAQPTGAVFEEGFRPKLTLQGLRHPVTAGLKGANATETDDPSWGRWFRLIDTAPVAGDTLMTGTQGRPALVLSRVGEGRVAQLLSDESWLWGRGFEGGGPQAELLRRLAHWLMKEPELEEEVLSGSITQGKLVAARRSMKDEVDPVIVTQPDGTRQTIALAPDGRGTFKGTISALQQGLYKLTDGTLTAFVAAGPLNPREFVDVRTTAQILEPLAKASGGGIHWLEHTPNAIPDIRRTDKGRSASGYDWIGLQRNLSSTLVDVSQQPLLPPAFELVLVALLFAAAWYRESR